MFRNETIDFEDQMKERLIVFLSALAIIVGWSSNTLLFKYAFVRDANLSWQEKGYIFTLMMILFAIITVLEWDVLFPDRQDFLNLTPLPVRIRTIFLSKLASFCVFVGLFSAAMTSFSSVLFSVYLADWRGGSLVIGIRYILSHVASGFAANFVVFFGCLFSQFFLRALFPETAYRRISLAVRFVLISGLVFLLLVFMVHPGILGLPFESLESLKKADDSFIYAFPPLWFVGLYEVLLGTSDPVFIAQARTALTAAALSLLVFALSALLSYRGYLRKTLDLEKAARPFHGIKRIWTGVVHRLFRMSHVERAVNGFFGATLRSSAKHRVTFAFYLAVGTATMLIFIMAFAARGWLQRLTPSNGYVLAVPMMILFILLAGIRSLVNLPAAPGANWIFRLTETSRPDGYVAGLKKAVLLKIGFPLSWAVFFVHAPLWGMVDSLLHAVFILGLSVIGIEALFLRYRKIPFACTSLPGKGRIYIWSFPGVAGVVVLLTAVANLEVALFQKPSRFAWFFLGVAVLVGGLKAIGKRLSLSRPLIYEEEPEPVLVGFPGTT